MKKIILGLIFLLWWASAAFAQSNCSPPIVYGAVLTAAQWQACFASKQNVLGYTPVNRAGDTMQGELFTSVPSAVAASLNLQPGVAGPSSPINGDMWSTATGLFFRLNGATVQLSSSAGDVLSVSNSDGSLAVSPTAGNVIASLNVAHANTWTALQTDQGLTTTQPGWYAQIAGDADARVRVGLNSTDVPSVAFGPGNAVRDVLLERAGPADIRFGAPDAAAPVAQTLSVQNVVAGTSNTAGSMLKVYDSSGTGNASSGGYSFYVHPSGSSGTAQNAATAALTISGGGVVAHPLGLTASTFNGNTFTAGTGTLTIAAGKTLTDTSGVGADILLGATGGGFAAYGGTSSAGNVLTALSATGAGSFQPYGLTGNSTLVVTTTGGVVTPSLITGTGTLTSGATGAGFTLNFGSSTQSGSINVANGGTGANNSSATGLQQYASGTPSVSTALANGTAATTQTSTDNTTKVATDAFVQTVVSGAAAAPHGYEIYTGTSSTTLTVSTGVTTIYADATACGGGSGGVAVTPGETGGASSGMSVVGQALSVNPGDTITITSGAAGTAGTDIAQGGNGGNVTIVDTTTSTTLLTLTGGLGSLSAANEATLGAASSGAGSQAGQTPFSNSGGATAWDSSGAGGSTPFGMGGQAVTITSATGVNGSNATGYGGGAGGSISLTAGIVSGGTGGGAYVKLYY
jgi:hypothetical protein